MRFSTFVAALFPVAAVMAELHVIRVGENGTLTFNPSNITAQDGDTIAFQFLSKNHTVTQSSFNLPCTNLSATGLDSGFQFIPANSTTVMEYSFNMTNTTGPLWFYCRQTIPVDHCQQGMVFSINETPQKTFQMFQQMAMASVNPGNSTNSTSPSSSGSSSGSPAPSSPAGASSAGSNSAASSASQTSSSSAGSASQTGSPNGAGMSKKVSGTLLLSGVGLFAGLVL